MRLLDNRTLISQVPVSCICGQEPTHFMYFFFFKCKRNGILNNLCSNLWLLLEPFRFYKMDLVL